MAYHAGVELGVDVAHEDVPPQLQEAADVLGRVYGTRLEVELLEPRLSGANEVDDLQILSKTENTTFFVSYNLKNWIYYLSFAAGLTRNSYSWLETFYCNRISF